MTNDGVRMSEDSVRMSNDGVRMSEDSVRMTNDGVRMSEDSVRMTNDGVRMSEDSVRMTNDGVRITNDGLILSHPETILSHLEAILSHPETILNHPEAILSHPGAISCAAELSVFDKRAAASLEKAKACYPLLPFSASELGKGGIGDWEIGRALACFTHFIYCRKHIANVGLISDRQNLFSPNSLFNVIFAAK